MQARVVLREEVTRDDIDDAMAQHGWQITNLVPATAAHPGQMILAAVEHTVGLYVVEDARLGVSYCAFQGERAAEAVAQVRASLACHEPGDALALLAGADTEQVRRGVALAVLQEPPELAQTALLALLADARAERRALALTAIGYAPLPGLREPVLRIAASDPDPALRQAAERLAPAFQASST